MIEEIYKILSLYQSFRLALISNKGRILLNDVKCLDDIDINKLKRKNMQGEGIYFIPDRESNVLLSDDLSEPDIIPYQSIIIQTSPKKFQAHILSDIVMLPEIRTNLQRKLVKDFNADPGAVSGMQPRRLPGFVNQKYVERPEVRIVKNTICAPDIPILDVSLIHIDKEPSAARKIYVSNPAKTAKKTWDDFYCEDFSTADMRYACYLARIGFSDAEIVKKLQNESHKISERKSGHIEDYLSRTIQKARQFLLS